MQLSILLYADDVALIAPDADSLQIMLNKLSEWCCKWRLAINRDKTKIIHVRPVNVPQCTDTFSCGNINIEMTDRYEYIGLWFQENLDMKFVPTKSAGRALSISYAKFKSVCGMAYEVYQIV